MSRSWVSPLVRVRLLRRVITVSPAEVWLPSARSTVRPGRCPSRRAVRAAVLRAATWLRVGASMSESSPAAVSASHALEEVCGGGVGIDHVDAVVVEIEPECAGVAGAQGEGGTRCPTVAGRSGTRVVAQGWARGEHSKPSGSLSTMEPDDGP